MKLNVNLVKQSGSVGEAAEPEVSVMVSAGSETSLGIVISAH
jgi:hypothetical protein